MSLELCGRRGGQFSPDSSYDCSRKADGPLIFEHPTAASLIASVNHSPDKGRN